MSGNLPMMLLVVGVLGAAALGFVKRCEFFGICDGQEQQLPPPPPPPPLAPAPQDDDNDGPDVNNVYINNPTQFVPIPYPVGHPYHGRNSPKCNSSITKHGRRYIMTGMSRLPDFQIALFPPQFIKEGQCVYQLTAPPPPPYPKPTPIERSRDCCKCKTSGYDSEVKCSNDGGKTWSVNPRFRYDIDKSLNDCTRLCRHIPPKPMPIPEPDNDYECNDAFCRRYPSKCPRCSSGRWPNVNIGVGKDGPYLNVDSKANYGVLQTNRMSMM